MNKLFAVIRREFVARVRTKAFVISTILLPVMMVAAVVVPIMMMSSTKDQTTYIAVVDASGSGLGDKLAQSLGAERLGSDKDALARYAVTAHPVSGDTQKLRDALIANIGAGKHKTKEKTDGVMVLDADTLSTGKVAYYGDNVGSPNAMQHLQASVSHVLATARLSASGMDPKVVMHAMKSADLRTTKVSDGKITGQSGGASFAIAYAMGFILYLSIIIYGQQTMTSVIEEKTSRIMEVLASSLTPFQMLLGKVLGVGSAGLAQMVIWGGSIFLLTTQRVRLAEMFGVGADAMQNFPIPTMSASLLVVFLLYFALGFLLFGALYAAIGAMCNTVQETQQYATVVTVLVLIGFFSVFGLINNPTGGLATTVSIAPFFSPFTMPVRWSLTSVPWSQLVLSLALMVAALLACVWLAARIYRTGILMYGKKPSFGELWRWIRAS